MIDTPDYARRFSGVSRLYGEDGLATLKASHICIIGIGGVGSWAVEALARNAIGTLTLIDLDNIAESNVNRQIHALDGAFGKAKVSAMRERIQSINPLCSVHIIEEFIATDTLSTMLDFHCDVILDCTDAAMAKVSLANFCHKKNIPLMMAGSAGGRLDPTQIQVADLAHVIGDKLLAKVRKQLRQDHQFPEANLHKKAKKFNIQAVYSNESTIQPDELCEVGDGITGLNCAGYGSSISVTATFGFTAAQWAINQLVL